MNHLDVLHPFAVVANVVNSGWLKPVYGVISGIVLLLLTIILWQRHQLKGLHRDLRISNEVLLTSINAGLGLDKHLNYYLEKFGALIQADGYYFYMFDAKTNNYMLRVTRRAGDGGNKVGPSYSGLVAYQKETYNTPLGLNGPRKSGAVVLIEDGKVPLLELPVAGGEGLIRIGPVPKVPRSVYRSLDYFGSKSEQLLKLLLATDKLKSDVSLVAATGKAISGLAQSAFDSDALGTRILSLCTKMLDAGGCALIKISTGKWELPVISGLERDIEHQFSRDQATWQSLVSLVAAKDVCMVTSASKELFAVPDYLVGAGVHRMLVLRMTNLGSQGAVVFWHYQEPELEQHRIAAAQMLVRRLGEVFEKQDKLREMSDSYIGMLRTLVETTDNIEPHTVGHSQLVANYATAIAVQLKLDRQDVRDIRLAAYFHDVGMLGLSSELLLKPGKFSAVEFETMKLHSAVGASIIESTVGNQVVASLIRHHHERWDGYGYPDGLSGEAIPLGARIIAVADMFNAKLGGRKYREAASFQQAVEDLRAASGTQLEPAAVEALIDWFRQKQADPARRGRSLGPCWEMRCCPAEICQHCPAFGKTGGNCWETAGVNCEAHGNQCRSCFVRTEAGYRETLPVTAGGM